MDAVRQAMSKAEKRTLVVERLELPAFPEIAVAEPCDELNFLSIRLALDIEVPQAPGGLDHFRFRRSKISTAPLRTATV